MNHSVGVAELELAVFPASRPPHFVVVVAENKMTVEVRAVRGERQHKRRAASRRLGIRAADIVKTSVRQASEMKLGIVVGEVRFQRRRPEAAVIPALRQPESSRR